MTAGYGRNDTDHGARNAVFGEGARHTGPNTIYGRFEGLQVETALLLTGTSSRDPRLPSKIRSLRSRSVAHVTCCSSAGSRERSVPTSPSIECPMR